MKMRATIGMVLTLAICGQQVTFAMDTGAAKERRDRRKEERKSWLERNWKKIAVVAGVCGGVYILYRIGRSNDRPGTRGGSFSSTGAQFEHDQGQAERVRFADASEMHGLPVEVEFVPAFRRGGIRLQPNGGRLTMTIERPAMWDREANKAWEGMQLMQGLGMLEPVFQAAMQQQMADTLRERGLPSSWRNGRVRCDLNADRLRAIAFMGEQDYLDEMRRNG